CAPFCAPPPSSCCAARISPPRWSSPNMSMSPGPFTKTTPPASSTPPSTPSPALLAPSSSSGRLHLPLVIPATSGDFLLLRQVTEPTEVDCMNCVVCLSLGPRRDRLPPLEGEGWGGVSRIRRSRKRAG